MVALEVGATGRMSGLANQTRPSDSLNTDGRHQLSIFRRQKKSNSQIRLILLTAILLVEAMPIAGSLETSQAAVPTTTVNSTIAGRVVEPDTKDPIADARVLLWQEKAPSPLRDVLTDENGQFAFLMVPPGRYEVLAWKAGWVETRYGQTRPERAAVPIVVREREPVGAILIPLIRGAVIEGRVTDAGARPRAGVSVQALRQRYLPSSNGLTVVGQSVTDDLGRYRIYGLLPGQYFLRFMLLGPAAPVPVGNALPEKGFVQTYFPGTSELSQARALTLEVGETQTGIDIVLGPLSLMTASLRLTGTDAAFASIAILRVDESGYQLGPEALQSEIQTGARILLRRLPPGPLSVVVRAVSAPGTAVLWGTGRIIVGDTTADVPIPMFAGYTVSGHVTLAEGSNGKLPEGSVVSIQSIGQSVVDRDEAFLGTVNSEGTFSVGGIPPGSYHIGYQGKGTSFVESITKDGLNVYLGYLDIAGDIPDIQVKLTERSSYVVGQLSVKPADTVTDFTVVLFPADPRLRLHRPQKAYAARLTRDGSFKLEVAAGPYLLAVTSDIEQWSWFDPGVLERLAAGALRVTVSPGETTVQNLRVASGGKERR